MRISYVNEFERAEQQHGGRRYSKFPQLQTYTVQILSRLLVPQRST